MISNTSRSGLKLVDKVELFSSGYQQKRQLSTSNCGKNNNNDDVSTKRSTSSSTTTLQLQNTSPFTFYSSATGNVTSPTECATIIIQRSSSEQIPKNVLPLVIQPSIQYANECIQNKPCNFYHSKQENELQEKCFNKFCKNSALSSDLNKKSGEISTTEVTSGDISNNCSCYSSNNIQQKLPICRTQDQEHAFRQIEDVHNYSKLNRYRYYSNNNCENVIEPNYSSNSSNQDEEDEDEEEVEGEGEGEEELEEELDEHDMAHYEQDTHKKQKTSALVKQQNQKICNIGVDDNVIRWNHQQKQQINVYNSSMEKLDPKENNDINNSPPDHHARRPMNAFLIFCKRHRGIVKDRYKHFENRSITKILGEWWASLDVNDKKCYVNLAKQNKDAFFSANPNFKWYKLPAPSLRTLNTRPGNNERPLAGSGDFQSNNIDSTSQGTESYAIHPSCSYTRNEPKKVSYFKLADETQMGELNNLMRPIGTPSNNDVLHEMLGETSDYFKSGCKRKSITCFDDIPSTKRLNNDNSFSSSEDDLNIKKSVRSCKGKKYQELMNSGQIAAVTPKKQVQSKAVVANVSSNNDLQTLLHNECLSKAPSIVKDAGKTIAQSKTQERCLLPEFSDSYESHIKQQFNFVSFDLEDKIKALPAQCLETYLQRKKNTKRKKKINSKKRSAPKLDSEAVVARSHLYQSKTIREVKEQIVGSQKRKARKESITRRDINSMQNDVQVLLSSGSVSAIVIGNNASANVVDLMPKSIIEENQDVTPDLLILAEVASNDTGIAQ